jgi:hypothetical protein
MVLETEDEALIVMAEFPVTDDALPLRHLMIGRRRLNDMS